MKRPRVHRHRWLLEGQGPQVKGTCACGETRLFANSFTAAIEVRFGQGKKLERSTLMENLAAQGRATRAAVLNEETTLAQAAMSFRRGER